VAAALGAVAGPALAERAPQLQSLADVKRLEGTLVAQAQAKKPETALGITGYRVEHVTLPETHSVAIQGRSTEVTEAWHVTVRFATPLTVRDQAFSLVIDGRWCGFLQEAPDLLSADTVCFDGTLIRNGAALGVTYRGVQIASGPKDEKALGPDAFFTDPGEAVHYASARLRLRRAR
jgi:type V secretory pathway adhesin AidA